MAARLTQDTKVENGMWISNSRLAFSVGRTESCLPNGTNSARFVQKLCNSGNRRVKKRSLANGCGPPKLLILKGWLTILDDFRNWLISAA